MSERSSRWWLEPKAEEDPLALSTAVFQYVEQIEQEQSWLFERFYRLNCLYDPYFRLSSGAEGSDSGDRGVSESVVASGIDTATAIVATAEIRPRVLIDEGDWAENRTAARLSWYGEGLGKTMKAHELGMKGFKGAALKGSGLAKVYVDWRTGEIKAETALIEDIIVPDFQVRGGKRQRQMHHRIFEDKEELKEKYPDSEEEIESTQPGGAGEGSWSIWAGYRLIEDEQLVVLDSWYLPYGIKGKNGYKPGRHTTTIQGHTLRDEEYHKPFFPFAVIFWSERDTGYYGIGAGERIAGHQRQINRLHHQIDRQQYKLANPTTWVQLPDANIAVRSVQRLGDVGVYKAAIPKTEIPPAVSPETYARLLYLRDAAFEEIGVTKFSAQGDKPGRLDSGAALREYIDIATQRFAPQEKAFERFVLDIIWLGIDAAKDLNDSKEWDAPVIIKKLAQGRKKLDWSQVDLGEIKVQLQAAATLSRTPAGRTQMVLEWAQGGLITQDEGRKLLAPFDPLDLDKTMSLYSAALDNLHLTADDILDGEMRIPEPFQNLQLGPWVMQQTYLQAQGDGAPEDVLENLRQWATQAAWMKSLAEIPQIAAPAMPTPLTQVAPQANVAAL